MFSKYMKLGFVESCIGKMLVYGACGTGKSSFMDLMVGNSPKQIRKSTPLAVRPVAMFQLDATGKKKWAKLTEKQRKEILIKSLMSAQSQQDQEEDSSSEDEEKSEYTLSPSLAFTGRVVASTIVAPSEATNYPLLCVHFIWYIGGPS